MPLLIAVMILFLLIFFGPVLKSPNSYLMAVGGDASKNYIIPAYYAKYDKGIHFSGMNYPYGDHILYSDGHFPVSWMLQQLERAGISATDYTVGVINYLMIASLMACAIFLFLLFRRLGIAGWFAIISSVGITLMTPQVQRMLAHYSLSYACIIPGILYFLFRLVSEEKKWKWVTIIILWITFFALLHFYHAAIAGAFLLSFILFHSLIAWYKRRFRWLLFGQMMVAALAPAIILTVFQSLADPVRDRIVVPWGFDFGFATFKSVFLPPDWNPFSIVPNNQMYQEGYAYIGLVTWLALLVYAVRQFLSFKPPFAKRLLVPSVNEFVLLAGYASIPVLLYAMQYPWCLNLRDEMEQLPVVRQLRALGRFTWPFYYATAVFAAYFLFTILRALHQKRKHVQWILLALAITVFWIYEGKVNVMQVKLWYTKSKVAKEYFHKDEYRSTLEQAGYNPSDFQAIIVFPFYHLGSEKFWVEAYRSLDQSLVISYELGLPLVNSYLNRTSVSQAEKLIQLSGSNLIEKTVLADLQDDKPFLLFVTGEPSDDERAIMENADSLSVTSAGTLYLLRPSDLNPDFEKVRSAFNAKRDSLYQGVNYLSSDSTQSVIYVPLTDKIDSFLAGGIYRDSGRVVLYSGKIPAARDSQQFHLSCWEKIFIETYDFPWFYFKQFNEQHQLVNETAFTIKNTQDVYDGWARLNFTFTLQGKNDSIVCYLEGRNLEVSRLLIHPLNSNIYTDIRNDGSFVLNNYFIPAKE